MGRQVRFYILPEEENEFLDFACQRPEVKLLRYTSPTPDFTIDRVELSKDQNHRQVYLWDSTTAFLPEFIHLHEKQVNLEEAQIGIAVKESYYIFDRVDPDIIEYCRPFFNREGKLIQARIFAEMVRLEGDHFVLKNQRFISWYEQIAGWLRKRLKNNKQYDAYISKKATEWWESGGILY